MELAETDHFRDGVRSATQASGLSQVARREEDWAEVAKLWAKAAYHMKNVPESHEQYALAEQKNNEYLKNTTYAMNQEKSAPNIFAEDFGDEWPFTVSNGKLQCLNIRRIGNVEVSSIVFTTGGKTYALNGTAEGSGKYLDVEPIWKDDPDPLIPKISMGTMISEGQRLCKQ
jgi:hypothetical protein